MGSCVDSLFCWRMNQALAHTAKLRMKRPAARTILRFFFMDFSSADAWLAASFLDCKLKPQYFLTPLRRRCFSHIIPETFRASDPPVSCRMLLVGRTARKMRRAKLDFDAARDTLDGEPKGGVVQFIDGKSEVAWSSF